MLVAIHVAVPVLDGVMIPEGVMVPLVALQVTAELKLPVPVTVAVQVAVWLVYIAVGKAATDTDVIVTGIDTVTVVEPNLLLSWLEVAVAVADPAAVGLNKPVGVMVPPVADQVTPEV